MSVSPSPNAEHIQFWNEVLAVEFTRFRSMFVEMGDAHSRGPLDRLGLKAGDRVLDVGCGFGAFRHSVPQARYSGLDPHFADHNDAGDVRNELLREHLVQNAGSYDLACAFQVIEHVREPFALFAEMVQAVRPGGLVVVSAPHVPSAHTRIPNFLVNAPPHHLTWWTREAFAALAARAGAAVEAVETVDWDEADSVSFWIERCSLIRCHTVHYRNSLAWHASFALSYYAGRVLNAIRKVPSGRDEGPSLMLVARRPASAAT